MVILLLMSMLISVWCRSTVAVPDLRQQVDDYIHQQMQKMRIPGIGLGIVIGGQIYYAQGYGVANSDGVAVTKDTPFLLASLSKSFTALAVMQLVEQGKLELDTPVRQYIPWFQVSTAGAEDLITVRHLLHQISGIPTRPGLTPPEATASLEQRVRQLAKVKLSQPVGEVFQYANHNYVVLGLLVEAVSGQSYAEYIEEHIFQPLRMANSFTNQQAAEAAGLAQGYRSAFGFALETKLDFPAADLPAGMLIASASDMTSYLQALLNDGASANDTVVNSRSRDLLWQPGAPMGYGAYAMGWMVSHDGETIAHGGSFDNYSSFMLCQPGANLGVVVLTNYGSVLHAGMPETIASGVAAIVRGQQPAAVNGLWLWLVPSILALGAVLSSCALAVVLRRRGSGGDERSRRRRGIAGLMRFLLAGLLLAVPSMALGTPLSLLVSLQPDVGLLLIINAMLLLVTALIQLIDRKDEVYAA